MTIPGMLLTVYLRICREFRPRIYSRIIRISLEFFQEFLKNISVFFRIFIKDSSNAMVQCLPGTCVVTLVLPMTRLEFFPAFFLKTSPGSANDFSGSSLKVPSGYYTRISPENLPENPLQSFQQRLPRIPPAFL